MTIYEIDRQILDLIENHVNPETGELEIDFGELHELQIQREIKIENIALYYKNLKAEAEAIKAEENCLTERRKQLERKAERMKELLSYALNGEKFSTSRVAVSYKKSQAVEFIDTNRFFSWAKVWHDELLRKKEPEPDKKAISEMIKSGTNIPGVILETRNNMVIK